VNGDRLRLRLSGLLVGLTIWALGAGEASALRRVALIVGNAKYEHAGVLANTLNDAHAIAGLLKKANFDVVEERNDLGIVEMKRVMRDFAAVASKADISVVYYSGHGIEADGVNYLIPVDARLASAFDVEDETLPLDRLLWATSSVKSLSLIILDACRENPFLRNTQGAPRTRGVDRHVIGEQATTANTLIAYAAKAGSVSYDGFGLNSPFTEAVVRHLTEPGVDIRIALGEVRDDVLAATGNRQEPYVYGSLGGESVSLAPASAEPVQSAAQVSAEYSMAERIGSADGWRAFIATHKDAGYFVDLARAQLARLASAEPGPVPARTVQPQPAPVAIKPERAPPSADDHCKTESARLEALRHAPSSAEISAFAAELSCPALKPQLARLMESEGMAASAPAAQPVLEASRHPQVADCESESREVEALRAQPDAARAKQLSDHLNCGKLRPQLGRILESLGLDAKTDATSLPRGAPIPLAAPPSEAAPRTYSAEEKQALCNAESAKLSLLRANPTRDATAAFAAAMHCDVLKPQVARLLESLGP
jgi:Caspase domain